jgi:hypothetical protein
MDYETTAADAAMGGEDGNRETNAAENEIGAEGRPAAAAMVQSGERFRSWVAYRGTGYERLTDDKDKLLVIKFRDKPSGEILELIKKAGFRYQPEYFGQTKVWTRRNDFEGRQVVEQVEARLRGDSQTKSAER